MSSDIVSSISYISISEHIGYGDNQVFKKKKGEIKGLYKIRELLSEREGIMFVSCLLMGLKKDTVNDTLHCSSSSKPIQKNK